MGKVEPDQVKVTQNGAGLQGKKRHIHFTEAALKFMGHCENPFAGDIRERVGDIVEDTDTVVCHAHFI